jgi:hypothetical protein
MTSEIAVMNQRAVALAADSAVTLTDGRTVVVRNDQRKLFNLRDSLPVGLMFYGVADIMGHPWEQLIEHHRMKVRPGALPHIRDHAASFVGMLDNLEEFFPRQHQKDDYRRLLVSIYGLIIQLAHYLREKSGKGPARVSDTGVLQDAIERIWRTYQTCDDGSARLNLTCYPPGFDLVVVRDFADVIEEMIAYGFSEFKLDAAAVQRLREIAVLCVVKNLFLEDVTGLVFAGYGSEERYPVVVTYFLSAIVGGIAKRAVVGVDAVDNENRSRIRLFADSEVTDAFIRGIDIHLEHRFYETMQQMMHGLVDHVAGSFGSVDPAQRESVSREFHTQRLPQYFSSFRSIVGDYQQRSYVAPILRVVEIASRSELAETARELVALNAFKKRIMAQQQTVGGAIDVAVVSRESGFQWWTRQGG